METKEAMLYEKIDGKVKCSLCSHRCVIADGNRGICMVRENRNGTLYSLVYGKAIATNVDPIEKKPLFHFLPGSLSFSVATIGCNFRCENCQNWSISQKSKDGNDIVGTEMSPEQIVESAEGNDCASISYTYTEPTVFFEYAYDISRLANEKGIKNVFVTNGFMTGEAIETIAPYLDAANVDLKSFSDGFYKKTCGASLEPVLHSLKTLKRKGVWTEVTTLLIPGLNDSEDELRQIAEFIRNDLDAETPWHISRFHPDYKLTDVAITPSEAIKKAMDIGREAGLHYIYAGNVPGDRSESTYCPKCNELLVKRFGFNVMDNRIEDSKCPKCKTKIKGLWM